MHVVDTLRILIDEAGMREQVVPVFPQLYQSDFIDNISRLTEKQQKKILNDLKTCATIYEQLVIVQSKV